ncbi:MAG: MarR family transcriptional regulator [Victivallaceae bacterium]
MIFNNANKFDDSEHEALMAIWWTGIMLRGEARKFFADKPASDTQFNVMMVLKYADHLLTQQELSRHLLVDQSNLTGLVDRMEKAGFLTRKKVEYDRRCYHLELTEMGHNFVDEVEIPYRSLVKKIMSVFKPKELAELTELMMRLQDGLDKMNK